MAHGKFGVADQPLPCGEALGARGGFVREDFAEELVGLLPFVEVVFVDSRDFQAVAARAEVVEGVGMAEEELVEFVDELVHAVPHVGRSVVVEASPVNLDRGVGVVFKNVEIAQLFRNRLKLPGTVVRELEACLELRLRSRDVACLAESPREVDGRVDADGRRGVGGRDKPLSHGDGSVLGDFACGAIVLENGVAELRHLGGRNPLPRLLDEGQHGGDRHEPVFQFGQASAPLKP